MTKTGKFLYGGFAIVALAGIVAMLVSIFSSPKQIAGENVETPIQPQLNKQKMETASPINKPTKRIDDAIQSTIQSAKQSSFWMLSTFARCQPPISKKVKILAVSVSEVWRSVIKVCFLNGEFQMKNDALEELVKQRNPQK